VNAQRLPARLERMAAGIFAAVTILIASDLMLRYRRGSSSIEGKKRPLKRKARGSAAGLCNQSNALDVLSD
jgi:hypothetical protein